MAVIFESFDSHTHLSGDWRQLPAIHEGAGIHIDAKIAATQFDSLMSLRRDVSAET